jgi:hypothetical protein
MPYSYPIELHHSHHSVVPVDQSLTLGTLVERRVPEQQAEERCHMTFESIYIFGRKIYKCIIAKFYFFRENIILRTCVCVRVRLVLPKIFFLDAVFSISMTWAVRQVCEEQALVTSIKRGKKKV